MTHAHISTIMAAGAFSLAALCGCHATPTNDGAPSRPLVDVAATNTVEMNAADHSTEREVRHVPEAIAEDQLDIPVLSETSRWSYEDGTDPITDVAFRRVSTTVEGQQYRLAVTITCVDPHTYTYVVRAFASNGAPAMFRGAGGAVYIAARPDDGRPRYERAAERGLNELSFGYSYFHPDIIAATQLTLRIPMIDMDEDIRLDQSDEVVRAALEPCFPTGESQDPETINRRMRELRGRH